MKKLSLPVIFTSAVLCSIPTTVAGQNTETDPDKVMIVLDSSGSMWGQIDGTPKRDIARTALGDMAKGFDDSTEIGLMAYGHRRKGDCGDIEVLFAPETGGADKLSGAVDGIRPVGKTPLSAAVKQAAETLKYEENKSTVILITDGLETCSLDPCETGASLEESGIDFTAHVIGFGLSEDEGRQVSCLAEETGGRYYSAKDAGGLTEALGDVADVVGGSPEYNSKDKVMRDAPPASITVTETPIIGAAFNFTWDGPNEKDDFIDIVPMDYERTFGSLSYVYTKDGSPSEIRAPGKPATYQMRYIWLGNGEREVIATTEVTIIDAEVTLVAPEQAALGSNISVDWKGPDNKNDYIDIVTQGYTATTGQKAYAYTESGSPAQLRVPGEVGAFEIRYVAQNPDGRNVLARIPLNVTEAGAELAFEPDMPIGGTLDIFWQGPDGSGDYIDIVPRGYTSTSGEKSYVYTTNANEGGESITIRLPGEPGEYDVRYVLDAVDGRRVLASAPLTLTPVSASITSAGSGTAGGTLALSVTGPASDRASYVDIVPEGYTQTSGELKYVYVNNEDSDYTISMPDEPGTYDMRYILQASDGRFVLAIEKIVVR